jgi:cell division protease FtsH
VEAVMLLTRKSIVTSASLPYYVPDILPTSIVQKKTYKNHLAPLLKSPAIIIGTVSFGDFIKDATGNKVAKVDISTDPHKLKFTDKNGVTDDVNVPNTESIELIESLIKSDILIEYQNDSSSNILYIGIVVQYVVIMFIGFMALQMLRNGQYLFGESIAKLHKTKDVNVKFSDVAGLDEAKLELQEVIDFLKKPEKYSIVGGKIPKGCLLVGPPGTGKTLLAKAIAGEAEVPFFSCSASEFIELFVGIGASRVRDLFKKAAEAAPCIIFIDEIDAIGKTRGSQSKMNGNDEREQTINQLLTEMDGFKDNSGIIIIAATNRVDVLDPALLRPGRFDRQINVDLPDFKDRIAILNVHTHNKPLDTDITIQAIAKITTGFSGADLANLANEAAILAARNNQTVITKYNFDKALERIVLGLEKKPLESDKQRQLVAYHEAGHTLLALVVGSYDVVRKVTILPRGKTGGVTLFEPDPERIESGLYSKVYLENQIIVALGGRVAEELVFGKNQVTTGASSDLEKVQQVARMMVCVYGFTDTVGPVAWKSSARFETHFSEFMLSKIDQEVQVIVNVCYDRAYQLLVSNRKQLDMIAQKLIEVETLTTDDLVELLE